MAFARTDRLFQIPVYSGCTADAAGNREDAEQWQPIYCSRLGKSEIDGQFQIEMHTAVATVPQLHQAAERKHISQRPAFPSLIVKVEQELAPDLFERYHALRI
jgi:hypothetical protein